MEKTLYQIVIKEDNVNNYILGRISGILDWCTYTDKIKETDVLHCNDEWIFNVKMYHETYLKVRDYLTKCYPNINMEYFTIIGDRRVED